MACKLYPAGATTNSDAGVTDLRNIYPCWKPCNAKACCCWCMGKSLRPRFDLFDREAVFIEQQLQPLRRGSPALKIVMEHITTRETADYVASADTSLGATITARTTCSTTAMPSSPAASARTTTACRS